MNLYYSPKFVSILKSMNCKISLEILQFDGSLHSVTKELNFLDIIDEKLGYISFSKNKKYSLNKREIDETFYEEDTDIHTTLWKKSRNFLKIGRLIIKLNLNFSNLEIEEFSDRFKSEVSKINFKSIIKIVSGEEIRKWYNKENYMSEHVGELGRSCMKYTNCHDFFDIYVDNPDICKLLIIIKNNKLIARAILWKVSSNKVNNLYSNKNIKFEYVLDRIYTMNYYDKYTMEEYALKNNWAIRKDTRCFSINKVIYYGSIKVKVKAKKYDKYPYMDTFCRFNFKKGILYNDSDSFQMGHILKNTNGYYKKSISLYKFITNKIFFL